MDKFLRVVTTENDESKGKAAKRQYLLKENADEDVNPLHFWQCTDEQILEEVVKKHMCIPATSCEPERMFSKAGQLISDRRCSLKPAVVDKILFINRNVDLNLN